MDNINKEVLLTEEGFKKIEDELELLYKSSECIKEVLRASNLI